LILFAQNEKEDCFMKIKNFFHNNGYIIVKLIVTHLCMAIFGIMVYIPFSTENPTGKFFCLALGVCAVIFYAYLIHIQMWDVGAKDSIDTAAGKRRKTPLKGFALGLIAAIPDILLCVSYVILWYYREYSMGLSRASITVGFITALWEGMFMGIKNGAFDSGFVYYFLIVPFVPAVFAELSYLVGLRQWKLFKPAKK
jgi:hypothetical protein